jgi:hypothetical protein
METVNNINKNRSVKRWLVYILPALLLFVVVQYAVLSIVSVRSHLKTEFRDQDKKLAGIDIQDTTLFNLYKEKTWLESRLQVAGEDSISLSVNMKDSVLQLELKGVVLKTSKVIDFKADRYFTHLQPEAYHHLFGSVASGESALATIEKVPLIVKKAPKDTAEYASQSHVMDSVKTEEVHWLLTLNNGIILKIEGTDKGSASSRYRNKFWWQLDMNQLKEDIRKTMLFKVPEYQPTIAMIVSEADARAIYRALPEKPSVCIRF